MYAKIYDEELWQEYLAYLYRVAEKNYGSCTDIDSLVQDTLTVMIVKLADGERIEHPKGFLSAVLKNKYNSWLREKYKAEIVEFSEYTVNEARDELALLDEEIRKNEEYEAVRREIGRLIRIYREVTVRHYVHGHSVDRISSELGIPRGTVLSRLASARDQIREGIENMEKYSQISYEPKKASLGIWGGGGLNGEPFSLLNSDIEANILYLAYENPVSVRGIADTMGMPSAYLEPIIDRLVDGEMMGRTSGGLVYTRCFVQKYEDSFGDVEAQEALAREKAKVVWEIARKHFLPLTEREEYAEMSDKQKATLILHLLNSMLNDIAVKSRPDADKMPKNPPERKDAGRWLATLTVREQWQKRDSIYDMSGPLNVAYTKEGEKGYTCKMYDTQSVFGDTHWAYPSFKYKCNNQSILRFYASFLDCGAVTDSNVIHELIPEFEKLCILKRREDGEIRLDIPALTFDETKNYWRPACIEMKKELFALLSDDLKKLWLARKNRVPKHVDEAEYYLHKGALGAFSTALLLELVKQELLPYPVTVGKTPIIFLEYRKENK